jgi:pimeloyl-ACP methyl ester carboxylesterase
VSDPRRPTVILLHGLARTHRSLASLQRHLERAGFPTWARSYPSRRLSIAAAAEEVAGWIARDFPDGRPLAAVTHSLGGILVRHVAARIPFTRIVMLAPPSQGSRVSRAFRDQPMYRWFYGPAGQEVSAPDRPRTWPKLTAPCAIIAGTQARAAGNPTSWVTRRGAYFSFDEPNDGTLAVEETRAADMTAFATVAASHTWIMNDARAREIVVRFLGSPTPSVVV